MKAISTLSIVPVRKEPSDRAEMVSQILFGEQFEVLESKGNWSHIKIAYDDYTGWIDTKQATLLEEKNPASSSSYIVTLDLTGTVSSGKETTQVVIGSSLPSFRDNKFQINQTEYSFSGKAKEVTAPDASQIIEHAMKYLNSPYLWGGRSPFGIDCSGFTQVVFKLCGIKLKRDAYQQAEQGAPVNSVQQAKEKDLAFFKNEEGRIVHVGIVLSDSRIIHASGKVHIDKLDEKGIFNTETNRHSHQLASIKRFC